MGRKEGDLQWMSFPDGDKPICWLTEHGHIERSPGVTDLTTPKQNTRLMRSDKGLDEWVADVAVGGEVVERIWPP